MAAEHIFKRHLGKTVVKKWRCILCDIQAVSTGIKPSFLYDYSSIEPIEFSKMVVDLDASGFLVKENLQVLSLGQDTFLANIAVLLKTVEGMHKALGEGRHVAVDVSANQDQPRLLDNEATQQLKDHTGEVLAQLRDPNCMSQPVLKLKANPGWNFSTMFGILLGYPVVYWYQDIQDCSNCLSMVPLSVYRVSFDFECLQNSSSKHEFSHLFSADLPKPVDMTAVKSQLTGHSIYSFSIPEALVPHFQDRIDDWFRGVQEKTHFEIQITCTSVTLPSVTL